MIDELNDILLDMPFAEGYNKLKSKVEQEFSIVIFDDMAERISAVRDAVTCIMESLEGNTSHCEPFPMQNQGESQLEQDMKFYAKETINKRDIISGLKLLSEITGGIAVFGVATTALTSWGPGLGILFLQLWLV